LTCIGLICNLLGKILYMRKQTFTTLVIVGCICILQSCAFRPCTTVSGNLGVVHSRILGESDSWSGAFGVQGGIAAELPFNCNFPLTLWSETNISMQGANYEDDFGGGTYEGTTRLWYINFPLTARYPFGNGFYGEAGIQPGLLLSAKDKFDGDSYDYRDYVKTFDLGIPLGIGYDFENNFGLSLRVIPGVTNINTSDYDSYKDHNFVVALRGTYTLKKKE